MFRPLDAVRNERVTEAKATHNYLPREIVSYTFEQVNIFLPTWVENSSSIFHYGTDVCFIRAFRRTLTFLVRRILKRL